MNNYKKIVELEIQELHEGKKFSKNKGPLLNFLGLVFCTILYLPKITRFKISNFLKTKNDNSD